MAHARALIAIGELGSFNKAGERLRLSPPAIFAKIHQLEAELGEKLYQRAGRKLVLTPAGRLVTEYSRRLILIHDEAIGAVKELGGAQGGSLCLGCGPHISVAIVPHLLRALISRHPHLQVRLITGSDHMLREDLHTGNVDLLLMNLPVDGTGLVQDPLWRYEMVFVVPPGDPAAGREVAAAELASRPFILCQPGVAMESVGFEPRVVMRSDQADSIRELVKLGLGISLLPSWSVSDDQRRGSLAIVRLENRQLVNVTGLLYRRTSHVPAPVRALIEVAHQWKTWLPRAEDLLEIET